MSTAKSYKCLLLWFNKTHLMSLLSCSIFSKWASFGVLELLLSLLVKYPYSMVSIYLFLMLKYTTWGCDGWWRSDIDGWWWKLTLTYWNGWIQWSWVLEVDLIESALMRSTGAGWQEKLCSDLRCFFHFRLRLKL